MLAAVFTGKEQIEVKEIPLREPEEEEIVIKVALCGVCGTDLHIYHGDSGAGECNPGTVLGHEFAGTVVKIGSGVKTLQIGDRVSVDPNQYCGTCYYCRNGKAHFCQQMIGIGTSVHGGFAEFCICSARQAYKIPDDMPWMWAAMAEPISCCLHGMDLSKIKMGDSVVIIGAGTIGLLMLQLAKHSGAAKVIMIEPVLEKHKIAYELGASLCIDPNQEDPLDKLIQEGLYPIDVCLECVGLGSTVTEAIRLCGLGGTVMLFGLTPPDCEVKIKPFDIFRRELHITSSFINPYTLKRSLALIESGAVKVEPLVGQIIPLQEAEKVFCDPSYVKKGKIFIVPEGIE